MTGSASPAVALAQPGSGTMILDALKLVKTGKVYEMSHLYESSMPMFGQRGFTLRIPGAPTGGPLGANNVIYHEE
jgi:hypothetical protein